MSIICFLGHTYYIYMHRDDIVAFTESISVAAQVFISIIKLFVIVFFQYRFQDNLNVIIDHKIITDTEILQNDATFSKSLQLKVKKILDECWNIATGQIHFFLFNCLAIMSFYFLNAIGTSTYHSIMGTANITYKHVFPTAYPFWMDKHNKFPYYEIIVVIDTCGDYVAGMISVCFDGLFVVMTLHAVALVRILKEMISFSTSENVDKRLRINILKECVDFHERTAKFCGEINALFSVGAIVQFSASLLELGIVLFEASMGLENDKTTLIKMIIYLLAAGYELMIYCMDGQKLITESETLAYAWYNTQWYNESKEFKKFVYMMILRTNKPIAIWAWGFIDLSLQTFLNIIKTSASYFIVLHNLVH